MGDRCSDFLHDFFIRFLLTLRDQRKNPRGGVLDGKKEGMIRFKKRMRGPSGHDLHLREEGRLQAM